MKELIFDHAVMQGLLEKAVGDVGEVAVLTRSILGRDIPIVTLGKGRRAVLYVGGIGGNGGDTARLLTDFIEDYTGQYKRNHTVYEYPMRYLFADRKIYIVPMLNPDGIEYALHSPGEENPLRERVLAMSRGQALSCWMANARGVDPAHNFESGFAEHRQRAALEGITDGAPALFGGEYPESEPETAALGRFMRTHREEICGVLTFGVGKGEISCSCRDKISAKTVAVGRVLSRFTGYRLLRPEGRSAEGGFADWCIEKMGRPAFSVTCDMGGGYSLNYGLLRRALFSFPCIL